MTELKRNHRISVFWDVENVHDDSLTHHRLTDTIRKSGTVDRLFAFADWDNRRRLAEDLFSLGYDLIHVPSGKDNAADYKMASYILEHLVRYPETTTYVMITGDGDFKLIAGAIKQRGLDVWIISNPIITASELTDIATTYTDIYTFRPATLDCADPADCDEEIASSIEYRRIAAAKLQEAVRAIVEAGNKPGVGHVKHVMIALNPEFSERLLGFAGWIEFLDWAEDYGYIVKEGVMPATIITIPDQISPEASKIMDDTKSAYKTFVKVIETRLAQGEGTTIGELHDDMKESGVEHEVIGYQRFSDFVVSAEKRGLVRVLASEEEDGQPLVIPRYAVDRMRSWFEENIGELFGITVNIPKDTFLRKIADIMVDHRVTLTQLTDCLRDDGKRSSYSSILEVSGIPFLPPFQMTMLFILLGKGYECEDAISMVNHELEPLEIVLICPS